MSVQRVKYQYRVIDQRAGSDQPPLLTVSIHHGVVRRDALTDDLPRAEDLGNYKVCEAGDIVLNRMRAFQGAIGISPQRGLVSPDYAVLRPGPDVNARYLHHLFRSAWFVGEMISRLRGIGNTDNGAVRTPRINLADLGDIYFDFPLIDEQCRIADFLDAETVRIDSLLRVYEAVKSALRERMQRVVDVFISEAGELVPLKYFVRFREGPGIMAIDFRSTGTPLIRISSLLDGVVTLNGANYLDNDMVAARWRQFRLRQGDYIISGSATMGAVSVVKDSAVVGAIPYTGLIILRPGNPNVVMEYVAAALTSSLFTRQIDLLKAGATMQHFGPTHLAQVSLPFPPREHQEKVASAIREVREHISKTTAAIDKQIVLLAERRQALITAAVTGGIIV